VLEIAGREANGSCGRASVGCGTALTSWSAAQRGALVSVGRRGGTRAGFVARLCRCVGRGTKRAPLEAGLRAPARSGRWRIELSIRPVLKHGPRSLTCMRAGGRQTH
jgi:hypothetical protein